MTTYHKLKQHPKKRTYNNNQKKTKKHKKKTTKNKPKKTKQQQIKKQYEQGNYNKNQIQTIDIKILGIMTGKHNRPNNMIADLHMPPRKRARLDSMHRSKQHNCSSDNNSCVNNTDNLNNNYDANNIRTILQIPFPNFQSKSKSNTIVLHNINDVDNNSNNIVTNALKVTRSPLDAAKQVTQLNRNNNGINSNQANRMLCFVFWHFQCSWMLLNNASH